MKMYNMFWALSYTKSSTPLQHVLQEAEVIEMDGFVIELDVDADEELMVSREEPYKPPDYRYCLPIP